MLGAAFDRDPFLLFELRGRTREEVLEATRAARGASPAVAAEVTRGVRLGRVRDVDYDAWRGPRPTSRLSFVAPARHAAVVAALGKPGSWREKATPAELLAPIMQSASTLARAIAHGTIEVGNSDDS